MASPSKVALIFGLGSNVGHSVAQAFAAKGYKIAGVSRSGRASSPEYLSIQADLSVPDSVDKAFATTIEKLGHPSVVVYNAAVATRSPATDLAPLSSLVSDTNVNVFSAYVAAQQAIKSFSQLDATAPDASKTFIYTGNKMPSMIIPPLLSAGIGKASAAHLMWYLADGLKDKGYKFYYADERKDNGDPVYRAVDGPAHGEFYTQLAEGETQGPWNATFVKGKGYVDFNEI